MQMCSYKLAVCLLSCMRHMGWPVGLFAIMLYNAAAFWLSLYRCLSTLVELNQWLQIWNNGQRIIVWCVCASFHCVQCLHFTIRAWIRISFNVFSLRSYSSLLLKPLAEPEIYMEICVHSFGFRRVRLQFCCLFPLSAKVCMFTKRWACVYNKNRIISIACKRKSWVQPFKHSRDGGYKVNWLEIQLMCMSLTHSLSVSHSRCLR